MLNTIVSFHTYIERCTTFVICLFNLLWSVINVPIHDIYKIILSWNFHSNYLTRLRLLVTKILFFLDTAGEESSFILKNNSTWFTMLCSWIKIESKVCISIATVPRNYIIYNKPFHLFSWRIQHSLLHRLWQIQLKQFTNIFRDTTSSINSKKNRSSYP